MAKQIQLRLTGENQNIVSTKKSVYNSNVLMGKCSIPDCISDAVESHHIFEQADCDEHGNTGHFHKNKDFNIVPLCKKCHAQITHGDLQIHGWLESSDGMELNYEFIENKQENKKKKYGPPEIFSIKQYNSKYGHILTKQKILDKLESDKGLKVSINIFNKIINGEY